MKFNKQFLFFAIQNLCIELFSLVDSIFSNHISLDSVCVMSAYVVVTWTTYSIYSIGAYAYRIVLSKVKMCFLMEMVTSVLLMIILYLGSPYLIHIYSLTDVQYEMLEMCIKIHALSLPIIAFGNFVGDYMEYQCMNKKAAVGHIILYVLMVVTDSILVYNGGTVCDLILCSTGCYCVYDIYALCVSHIMEEPNEFSWKKIKELVGHDANTVFDRVTGKIATIVYNVYASKLGTQMYAIHGVCYAFVGIIEAPTNGLNTYLVIFAQRISESNRFGYCVKTARKYGMAIVPFVYGFCFLMLILTHGKVPLSWCLPWMFLYASYTMTLVFYESMKSYLMSMHETGYLRYGGVIGMCVRIPFVVIGNAFNFGLMPFAIVCFFDFGLRGVYFYLASRKLRKMSSSKKMIIERMVIE